MDLALINVATRLHQLPLSLHNRRLRRPSFPKHIYFAEIPSFSPLTPIRASVSDHSYTPKPQIPQPLNHLKSTFITGVTVAALLIFRFTVKPAVADPISGPPPPATVETTDSVSYEEKEKTLEDHLSSHPEDVEALKTLVELKMKNCKVQEAIGRINQLINLEPNEHDWLLLKSHLHSLDGNHESAKLGFEEILSKDPLRVEAYHGLVMALAEEESSDQLKEVEKRIIEAMEKCKEKKDNEMRKFRLLLAQIRVMEGDYSEALKIYQDLSDEEPQDFRPYLCQGIIYTLLMNHDDADKNFEKYRNLVPKEHPHARYFDENMVKMKALAHIAEN